MADTSMIANGTVGDDQLDSSHCALRVLSDDDLLSPFSQNAKLFVARRERAPLIFFHDSTDDYVGSLPKNWSLPCTEFSTAQDVAELIAAQCDHDVTRGAVPQLYWQHVGDAGLVDDAGLRAVDAHTLLTDFVSAAERLKCRIRFLVRFAPPPPSPAPVRTLSPSQQQTVISLSSSSKRVSSRAPVTRTKSNSALPPLSKSGSIIVLTEPGSPSAASSPGSAAAAAADDALDAVAFSSTTLSTSERVCAACDTWLAGDVVAAAGRHFHPACFACEICQRPLAVSQRFQLHENRIACTDCGARHDTAPAAPPAAVASTPAVAPSTPTPPPAATLPPANASPPASASPTPTPTTANPQPQPRARQQQLGMHRASYSARNAAAPPEVPPLNRAASANEPATQPATPTTN